MKKIQFGILAMYFAMLATGTKAQQAPATDSSHYKIKKLTLDEINIVSGYYHQDGNNSAVTGGIGTEKLTDFANTFDVQVSKVNKNDHKHTFLLELGIDHYTSASSDKIDPNTISSASSADTRIYPSLTWTNTDNKTGNSFGASLYYSSEYDYQSIGAGLSLSRISKDQNRQFDVHLQAFLDHWTVILPYELRPSKPGSYEPVKSAGSEPRNSFSASFALSQVINTRLQAMVIVEPSYQHGLLATRYQRNYFTDGSVLPENLPGNRYKLPIGLRLNYFLDDHFIIRTFYRFYMDDWGVRAHTAEIEVPIKFTSFVSLSPFYRYNTQQGTRYFAPYGQHAPGTEFFTSDYDLATQHSSFVGTGLRLAPPRGVFHWQRFNQLELRYGHYMRSTGLNSNILTLGMKFK